MHKLYYMTISTPIPISLPMGLRSNQQRTDKALYIAETDQQLPDGFIKYYVMALNKAAIFFMD